MQSPPPPTTTTTTENILIKEGKEPQQGVTLKGLWLDTDLFHPLPWSIFPL
jgi:hypothetical protein